MPLILFLAFLVVPVIELAVIIQVGEVLGVLPTLVLLVALSIAGAALVRREGMRAWRRFRSALDELRLPTVEVIEGALVLLGGALLLTPGFITDAVGLLLLLPPTRALVARYVRRRVRIVTLGAGMPGARRPPAGRWGSSTGTRRRGAGAGDPRRPDAVPDDEPFDVEIVSIDRDDPAPATDEDEEQ